MSKVDQQSPVKIEDDRVTALEGFTVPQPTESGDNEATTQNTQVMVMECVRQLREVRISQGIELKEIARRSGLGTTTLGNLESHRATNPRVDTLARYALALNMELSIAVAPVDPDYRTDFD